MTTHTIELTDEQARALRTAAVLRRNIIRATQINVTQTDERVLDGMIAPLDSIGWPAHTDKRPLAISAQQARALYITAALRRNSLRDRARRSGRPVGADCAVLTSLLDPLHSATGWTAA